MKHGLLWWALSGLLSAPGAIRCYFRHSDLWKRQPKNYPYDYRCPKCGREWGFNVIPMSKMI